MIPTMDNERGAAMVEFALVVSLLLLLLLGIVQFGFAFHVQQGLQAGAREGARMASLPQVTGDQIRDRVKESVSGIDVSQPEQCPPSNVGSYCITVTPNVTRPCNRTNADIVTVNVAHRVRIEVPLWSSPEIVLAGKGVYRCEV